MRMLLGAQFHPAHLPRSRRPSPSKDRATKPTASIIIVGHDRSDQLIDCLTSVSTRTTVSHEIVVVAPPELISWLCAKRLAIPGLVLITTVGSHGFGRAANIGAAHACGEVLAFLNPDTRVQSGWLSAMMEALGSSLDIGLVTPQIRLMDRPDRLNTCGSVSHITGMTFCRGLYLPVETFQSLEEVNAVSGAAFAIRRKLFEQLHGFDESFFMYLEDTDLSWRARLLGYRCIYTPSAIVYHEYRGQWHPWKIARLESNRYSLLIKTLRWHTLALLSPALILLELMTWAYMCRHGPRYIQAKLYAYYVTIRRLGALLEKRQQMQQSRCVSDLAIVERNTHRLSFEWASIGPRLLTLARTSDPLFLRVKTIATKALGPSPHEGRTAN